MYFWEYVVYFVYVINFGRFFALNKADVVSDWNQYGNRRPRPMLSIFPFLNTFGNRGIPVSQRNMYPRGNSGCNPQRCYSFCRDRNMGGKCIMNEFRTSCKCNKEYPIINPVQIPDTYPIGIQREIGCDPQSCEFSCGGSSMGGGCIMDEFGTSCKCNNEYPIINPVQIPDTYPDGIQREIGCNPQSCEFSCGSRGGGCTMDEFGTSCKCNNEDPIINPVQIPDTYPDGIQREIVPAVDFDYYAPDYNGNEFSQGVLLLRTFPSCDSPMICPLRTCDKCSKRNMAYYCQKYYRGETCECPVEEWYYQCGLYSFDPESLVHDEGYDEDNNEGRRRRKGKGSNEYTISKKQVIKNSKQSKHEDTKETKETKRKKQEYDI